MDELTRDELYERIAALEKQLEEWNGEDINSYRTYISELEREHVNDVFCRQAESDRLSNAKTIIDELVAELYRHGVLVEIDMDFESADVKFFRSDDANEDAYDVERGKVAIKIVEDIQKALWQVGDF